MATLTMTRIASVRIHPLALITLAGLALRLLFIGAARLWYDESGSVWMATLPFERMIAATAGDTHPPLYLALLWAWVRVAGSGEAAARLPSALFSLACIPITYAIGGRLKLSQSASLVAAGLVAVLPPQLHYAQEARMYSLLTLEFALGLWAALTGRAPLLALALGLMYWTHNYGLLYAVPLNLVLLGRVLRTPNWQPRGLPLRELIWIAWWNVLALIAWFPWCLTLIYQMRQVGGGYWIPAVTPGAVLYVLHMITWSYGQGTVLQAHQALLVFGALVFAIWRTIIRPHTGARLCVGLAAVALAVPVIVSLAWRPVLLFRALLPVSIPICLLFGWAFVEGLSVRRRTLLALMCLPLVAVSAAIYYIRVPELKSDLTLTDYIDWKPGDIVYHINDGSLVANHAYTPPEWPQYQLPAAWQNIGALSPATRQALGIQIYFLEEIKWRRAWLVHGATPMTTAQEDEAVQAILNTYPHQLIYLNEGPATRQVIYLIWNKGVAVQ